MKCISKACCVEQAGAGEHAVPRSFLARLAALKVCRLEGDVCGVRREAGEADISAAWAKINCDIMARPTLAAFTIARNAAAGAREKRSSTICISSRCEPIKRRGGEPILPAK